MFRSVFVALIGIAAAFGSDNRRCRTSALAGKTDFKDESFPAIAQVVNAKTKNFICNAVIIAKKQILVGKFQ
jgi:hypothetical protein